MPERTTIKFVRGAAADIGAVVPVDGKPFWAVDTHVLYMCQSGVWYQVGGVTDGDKVDITVTDDGETWTIDDDVVDNEKAADMPANTIKCNPTGSTDDPSDAAAGDFTTATPAEADLLLGFQGTAIRTFSIADLRNNGGIFFFMSKGGFRIGGDLDEDFHTEHESEGGVLLGGGDYDAEEFDTPGDDTYTLSAPALLTIICRGAGEDGDSGPGDGGMGGDYAVFTDWFPAGTYDVHVPDANDGRSGSRDSASGAWFSDGDPDDYVYAENGDSDVAAAGSVGNTTNTGGAGGNADGDAGGGGGGGGGPTANGNAGGNAIDPTPGTGGAASLSGPGGDGGANTANGSDGTDPSGGGGGAGTGGTGGGAGVGRVTVIRVIGG